MQMLVGQLNDMIVQLDDWLADHEAKEAAEKQAEQSNDGWTVVRRKGVSIQSALPALLQAY